MRKPEKTQGGRELRSQEEVEAALVAGAQVTPIDVPSFYATAVRIALEPNNVNVIFSRAKPIEIKHADAITQAAHIAPTCILDLSPQTAKDLMLLLQDGIAKHEANWGAIETDFSRRRSKK